ncbi:MAG: GAF domain-containing protein [Spirochaetales bacterium]|nr:GAF domain-containing protein [Spirochaetales bacterium]
MNNDSGINVPEDIIKNWQEIVDVLSQIVDIPAALIMKFSEPEIEVFVASSNEDNPYRTGEKEKLLGSGLYCERVIKTGDKLLVPNALTDRAWKNNPDTRLHMISYLGFPILLPDHKPFGTICVLDNKPNGYSKTIEKLMTGLRDLIQSHLEIIYMNQVLGDENKRLSDYLSEIRAFRGLVPICSNCKNIRDEQGIWHPIEHFISSNTRIEFSHTFCPICAKKLYPDMVNDE